MTNDQIRELYNRVVPILAAAGLVFAIVALGWSWQNSAADHRQDQQRDKDQDAAVSANQANAVTNCENANESRKANRAMWGFVLDLLQASNPDASPAESAFLGEFRGYVNTVYQAHDCDHLDTVYDLPHAPTIPTP